MLRHHRRIWAIAIWLVLSAPLLAMLLVPAASGVDRREMRALATWPVTPRSRGDWRRLPGRIDAYLADHFGLREPLLRAEALIAQRLLRNGNEQVLIGRDGWLFYRAFNVLQQSAGLRVREARVAETADTLARVARALEARGTRFLVAVPPSSSTIQGEHLPDWARNRGRPTEYDRLLAALVARGVEAVDLRPALRAAADQEQVYHRHDTHWNKRGALEAFNTVATAAGHPDWRLDPSATLVAATRAGGDLARMLGIDDAVTERAPAMRQLRVDWEVPESDRREPIVLAGDHDGPTVLVVGDSFTRAFFPPLVLARAGRYAWTHHQSCGLDWRWVERVDPDEVWWMPTERILLCTPGTVPAGLDPASAGYLVPTAIE